MRLFKNVRKGICIKHVKQQVEEPNEKFPRIPAAAMDANRLPGHLGDSYLIYGAFYGS